jgi:hypothetical protein
MTSIPNTLKITSREESPFKGHYPYLAIPPLITKRTSISLKVSSTVSPFTPRGSLTLLDIYFNMIALQ